MLAIASCVDNRITDRGCAALSCCLPHPTMEKLDLMGNKQLTEAGIESLELAKRPMLSTKSSKSSLGACSPGSTSNSNASFNVSASFGDALGLPEARSIRVRATAATVAACAVLAPTIYWTKPEPILSPRASKVNRSASATHASDAEQIFNTTGGSEVLQQLLADDDIFSDSDDASDELTKINAELAALEVAEELSKNERVKNLIGLSEEMEEPPPLVVLDQILSMDDDENLGERA